MTKEIVEMANGWGSWSKHVLKELERLDSVTEQIRSDVVHIKENVSALKVRAGMIGLIAASIPSAIAIIYTAIK